MQPICSSLYDAWSFSSDCTFVMALTDKYRKPGIKNAGQNGVIFFSGLIGAVPRKLSGKEDLFRSTILQVAAPSVL